MSHQINSALMRWTSLYFYFYFFQKRGWIVPDMLFGKSPFCNRQKIDHKHFRPWLGPICPLYSRNIFSPRSWLTSVKTDHHMTEGQWLMPENYLCFFIFTFRLPPPHLSLHPPPLCPLASPSAPSPFILSSSKGSKIIVLPGPSLFVGKNCTQFRF